jgi:hypothetical protein
LPVVNQRHHRNHARVFCDRKKISRARHFGRLS